MPDNNPLKISITTHPSDIQNKYNELESELSYQLLNRSQKLHPDKPISRFDIPLTNKELQKTQ